MNPHHGQFTRLAGLIGLLLALAAAVPAAADLVEGMKTAYILETRLMDQEYARYMQLRDREQAALEKLARLSRQIDGDLVDQSVGVEDHRNLESQITEAREQALTWAREAARLRQQLYLRLDRLTELGLEIERHQDRTLIIAGELNGQWEIEAPGAEAYGLLNLKQEGTVVTGVYRMSTGAQGSLQGTLVDNVLKLDRIDAKRGRDLRLEGQLDTSAGEIHGRWWPLTAGSGEPVGGEWSARKLSPGD